MQLTGLHPALRQAIVCCTHAFVQILKRNLERDDDDDEVDPWLFEPDYTLAASTVRVSRPLQLSAWCSQTSAPPAYGCHMFTWFTCTWAYRGQQQHLSDLHHTAIASPP